MGCGTSAEIAQVTTTASSCPISEHDKRIAKRTWAKLSNNMSGLGALVFLQIFNNHPHVKQLFPFRNVTGDALLQDPNFKGHASRFMQSVGAAVDNIDDLDASMAPLLFGIGQDHVNYKGFNMEYFDLFTEGILQIFQQELKSKYTSEVEEVWKRIFMFMMSKLKEGYNDAAKINECNENFMKHMEGIQLTDEKNVE